MEATMKVTLDVGEYAFMEVNSCLVVQVKRENEGFVIDAISKKEDDVIGSIAVWNDDLNEMEENNE